MFRHFNYEISLYKDTSLGQEGFFDAFKIKFEKDHNIIKINHSKKH